MAKPKRKKQEAGPSATTAPQKTAFATPPARLPDVAKAIAEDLTRTEGIPPAQNFTEAKRRAKEAARARKSPHQKRAEAIQQREEWNEERIAEAFAAAGGTPKEDELGEEDEEPRHPGGRPSLISEIDMERVEALAAGGLTKYEIAYALGISRTTLKNYQVQYPAFLAAIKRGKARDLKRRAQRAEDSMHKLANGFTILEEKVQYDMQVGKWVRTTVAKVIPPDARAQHLILQHAETGSWKTAHDHKVSGNIAMTHKYKMPETRPLGT